MKLRNYQQQNILEIYKAWDNNAQNVLYQLDTGGGKTVIFSHIVSNFNKPSIIIAHRSELLDQISLTLARYKIRHNIIAQKATIRNIAATHMQELNTSFFNPNSSVFVASVDSLIRLDKNSNTWMKRIRLVVQDEAHHVLRKNKWGTAAAMFPNARGLYVTATPLRADGQGLGRHADGVIDVLISGPGMRWLINNDFLTEYKIHAPRTIIDLTNVPITNSGDFSPQKLRTAVHKSTIVGDVVKQYLKIARGKQGITFAVDVEHAEELTRSYKAAGVNAELLTAKTPILLRAEIMRRFRNKKVLQIVNVDICGEGVDVPGVEVISMARPTQSYSLFSQMLGRALRPAPNKTHAIIIDHVNNVERHGLPDDLRRVWSLDRRESRKKTEKALIQIRTCYNVECALVYSRTSRVCPYCGHYPEPIARSSPDLVDGDLIELDPDFLAKLRGEINRIDGPARAPRNVAPYVARSIERQHYERQDVQKDLRKTIAQWAGGLHEKNKTDSEIYRGFYLTFGIDIASAQTLGVKLALELMDKIKGDC